MFQLQAQTAELGTLYGILLTYRVTAIQVMASVITSRVLRHHVFAMFMTFILMKKVSLTIIQVHAVTSVADNHENILFINNKHQKLFVKAVKVVQIYA